MNRYERMLQQQYRDLTPSRSSNSAAEDDVSPSLLPSALAAARTRARYSGSPSSSTAGTSSAAASAGGGGGGLLMDRGTDPMLPSTSTRATLNTSTTSSTHSLSDLAQAASSQLMAENNSVTTALTRQQQASETATPSPASPSSRESSVERENPEQHLLNDHSYSFGLRQR